ncbi:MAG: hypothetical protein BGP07_00175 [Rhizobiales bacterium 63-22]|nr:MAG: hypothetical protein BGP07_00175 [Rhizobiales bacterium 63-22]
MRVFFINRRNANRRANDIQIVCVSLFQKFTQPIAFHLFIIIGESQQIKPLIDRMSYRTVAGSGNPKDRLNEIVDLMLRNLIAKALNYGPQSF